MGYLGVMIESFRKWDDSEVCRAWLQQFLKRYCSSSGMKCFKGDPPDDPLGFLVFLPSDEPLRNEGKIYGVEMKPRILFEARISLCGDNFIISPHQWIS